MSRFELPEGVPADNEGLKTKARFAAPDMATPAFARPAATDYSRVVVVVDEEDDEDGASEVVVKKDEKDDEDGAIEFPMPPMPWVIAGSAAVALVALAFIISNDRVEPQPYCSQQPDWNQYNCIPG